MNFSCSLGAMDRLFHFIHINWKNMMNIMRNNTALLTIIIIHKFIKHVLLLLLLLIIINEVKW